MHTRRAALPRLLLLLLAALLLVGAPPSATAAPVNADDELRVARVAYDTLNENLYKEPDTVGMLNTAYDAAQQTLKVTGQPLNLSGGTSAQWDTFAGAVRGLARQANADLPENTLRTAMIRGMTRVVNDGHTAYISKQSYDRIRMELRGDLSIVNYGFRRMNVGNDVYMRSVVPGSNIAVAGARAGDQILTFDGQKMTPENANDLLANPKEGDRHTFMVRHVGETQPVELAVTLRKYDRSTIYPRVLDGHIGYLQITDFYAETPGKIDAALAEFARQGVDVLIVDLRQNGGGLETAAQSTIGRFVPNGTVLGTNGGRQYRTRNIIARSDGKTPNTWPLVVLTDGNSASASEYFAVAVRDFRAATIVGVKTTGLLGSAQLFRLSDGSALEVTISEYTSTRGEKLNGIGVEPDVNVPNATDDEVINGRDPQLDQAVAQANTKVGR